jgi:membrane protein
LLDTLSQATDWVDPTGGKGVKSSSPRVDGVSRFMRALRNVLSSFLDHEGFFLAGGLAFYFLICFIPFLFLMVSSTGFILSPETVTGQIKDGLSQNVPVYQEEITRFLLRVIETRRHSGVVGTIILLLFSTQLFATFRVVLNRVLGVKGHPLWHGMLFDMAMVLLISLFFIANVGTTAVVAWVKLMAARQIDIPAHWMGRMSIALGFAFAVAMYFVIYRFFAYRAVASQAALVGAIVASVLWELAKHFLRVYVVSLGLYDEIYGPLGVLMAFIMFIYYSAIVFVFGAEVVAMMDPGD